MKSFSSSSEVANERWIFQNSNVAKVLKANFDDIFPYLDNALRECDEYEDLKDKLINTKIDPITARNVIKRFFRDETEEHEKTKSLNVRRLERIYEHDLWGGHLDTRQGNAFRLQQAFTQWTSHHRKAKTEDYRFSQKLGGDLARLDNRATELIREAVGVWWQEPLASK